MVSTLLCITTVMMGPDTAKHAVPKRLVKPKRTRQLSPETLISSPHYMPASFSGWLLPGVSPPLALARVEELPDRAAHAQAQSRAVGAKDRIYYNYYRLKCRTIYIIIITRAVSMRRSHLKTVSLAHFIELVILPLVLL